MKTVKKNVYYCDYCKKRKLTSHAMLIHERHCTANPHRECRMCEITPERINELIEEFKKRFTLEPVKEINNLTGLVYNETFKVIWKDKPVTLEEVRNSVDGCPNCMLAIIRQCKFSSHYFEDFENFDYNKEMEEAIKERNRDKSEYSLSINSY
jgi:hypothetical protein